MSPTAAYRPIGAIPLLREGACFCTPVFRDLENTNRIWIQDPDPGGRVMRFLSVDEPDGYTVLNAEYPGTQSIDDEALSAFRHIDGKLEIGTRAELELSLRSVYSHARGVLR